MPTDESKWKPERPLSFGPLDAPPAMVFGSMCLARYMHLRDPEIRFWPAPYLTEGGDGRVPDGVLAYGVARYAYSE